MSVRAKFHVTERTETTYGGKVKLSAVSRGEDNAIWSSATPYGSIEMTIRNEVAMEHFKPGIEMWVEFTEAPKAE